MSECVYLLQPQNDEYIKNNVYKIGRSRTNDFVRCKSYGKNTKYYCMFATEDSEKLEKQLKISFAAKYNLFKGREWFSGEISQMRKDFLTVLLNNENFDIRSATDSTDENIDKSSLYEDETTEDVHIEDRNIVDRNSEELNELRKIKKIFPNYLEDTEFGGNKALCYIDRNEGSSRWVFFCIEDKRLCEVNSSCNGEEKYLSKLFKCGIIEEKQTYDLHNNKFVKSLIKYKDKMEIIGWYDDVGIRTGWRSSRSLTMENYFTAHCIINKKILCIIPQT